MKKILIMLMFLSSYAYGETTYQLQFGQSISNHTFVNEETRRLKNKLTENGKYVKNQRGNFSIINKEGSSYSKTSFLFGNDCLDSPIYGLTLSSGIKTENNHEFGFIFGGYKLDEQVWIERGITPYWLDGGIVPIIGLEVQFELIEFNDHLKLNFHNMLSPWLTNHGLLLTIEF